MTAILSEPRTNVTPPDRSYGAFEQRERANAVGENQIPRLSWLKGQLSGLDAGDIAPILKLANAAIIGLEQGRVPTLRMLAALENPETSAVLSRVEKNALQLFATLLSEKANGFSFNQQILAVTVKEDLRARLPNLDQVTGYVVMGAAMGMAEAINRGESQRGAVKEYTQVATKEIERATAPTLKQRMLNGLKSFGAKIRSSVDYLVSSGKELVANLLDKSLEVAQSTVINLQKPNIALLERKAVPKPIVQTVTARDIAATFALTGIGLAVSDSALATPPIPVVVAAGPQIEVAEQPKLQDASIAVGAEPQVTEVQPAREEKKVSKDNARNTLLSETLQNLIDGTNDIPNSKTREAVQDLILSQLAQIEAGKTFKRGEFYQALAPFLAPSNLNGRPTGDNLGIEVGFSGLVYSASMVCNYIQTLAETLQGAPKAVAVVIEPGTSRRSLLDTPLVTSRQLFADVDGLVEYHGSSQINASGTIAEARIAITRQLRSMNAPQVLRGQLADLVEAQFTALENADAMACLPPRQFQAAVAAIVEHHSSADAAACYKHWQYFECLARNGVVALIHPGLLSPVAIHRDAYKKVFKA